MNKVRSIKASAFEPLETQEQQDFIKTVRMYQGTYPCLKLLFAVPNQAARDPANQSRMKAEGLISGVPDLILPVARGGYFGWAGEMKRLKSGSLSPEQREYILALRGGGYWASWHRGADEMWRDLMFYLALPPTEPTFREPAPDNLREVLSNARQFRATDVIGASHS